jgi:hypothetical protein
MSAEKGHRMNESELQSLSESVAALNDHHRRLSEPQTSADEKNLCTLLSTANVLMIEGICRKELRGEELRRVDRGTVGLEREARSGSRGTA